MHYNSDCYIRNTWTILAAFALIVIAKAVNGDILTFTLQVCSGFLLFGTGVEVLVRLLVDGTWGLPHKTVNKLLLEEEIRIVEAPKN